jgi:ribosomal protein L7/L12
MIINVNKIADRYVAEVQGMPELTGTGPSVGAALRNLANAADYMGEMVVPETARKAEEPRVHVNVTVNDKPFTPRGRAGDVLTQDEMEMVADNRMLAAVKCVKERLGIGLKEAKEIVDDFRFSIGVSGHR